MSPVFARERVDAGVRDDASISAAKYELTLAELTQREDPKALAACVSHNDVFDHR